MNQDVSNDTKHFLFKRDVAKTDGAAKCYQKVPFPSTKNSQHHVFFVDVTTQRMYLCSS